MSSTRENRAICTSCSALRNALLVSSSLTLLVRGALSLFMPVFQSRSRSIYSCMHVFICVCLCVCTYLCMYVCVCVCVYVSVYVSVWKSLDLSLSLSLYVCMYVCMYAFMFVCMYVCACVRMRLNCVYSHTQDMPLLFHICAQPVFTQAHNACTCMYTFSCTQSSCLPHAN